MLEGPPRDARSTTRPNSAALAVAYALWPAGGWIAEKLEMKMTCPVFLANMPGSTADAQAAAPLKLTSQTSFQLASVSCASGASRMIPAVQTNKSTGRCWKYCRTRVLLQTSSSDRPGAAMSQSGDCMAAATARPRNPSPPVITACCVAVRMPLQECAEMDRAASPVAGISRRPHANLQNPGKDWEYSRNNRGQITREARSRNSFGFRATFCPGCSCCGTAHPIMRNDLFQRLLTL